MVEPMFMLLPSGATAVNVTGTPVTVTGVPQVSLAGMVVGVDTCAC